jgi:hypothetical protein
LDELGGIYAAFARFLGWRADLLDASYISHLRRVRLMIPAIPAPAVAANHPQGTWHGGRRGGGSLAEVPLWNTLARTAYLSGTRIYR